MTRAHRIPADDAGLRDTTDVSVPDVVGCAAKPSTPRVNRGSLPWPNAVPSYYRGCRVWAPQGQRVRRI
jgi:hypothetical protein